MTERAAYTLGHASRTRWEPRVGSGDFAELTGLELEGYERDLSQVLSGLKRLQKLSLRSMKRMTSLDAVAALREVRTVVKLAGMSKLREDDVRTMTALLAEHQIDGEVFMYPQVRGSFPWFT